MRELMDHPALAWRVLDGAARMVHVAGPWLPEDGPAGIPARWARRYPGGGIATWTSYPATEAMLHAADSRLLTERPVLSLVGRHPCEAPGIVPACGETHPMALADGLRWPPPAPTETARCERPAGHHGACGGTMSDGRQGTASNAVEREERLKSPATGADG